jgi:hypothetical protein
MKKSAEKGQAFMEFIVCLIPLVVVFSGLILIAVLGRANVKSTIQARSLADLGTAAEKAVPQNILYWDYGKDRVPFTADDMAITGSNTYLIAPDLDTEINTVTGTFDTNLKFQDMHDREFVSRMPGRVSFTNAANLNGAAVTINDVLARKNMKFFERMFHLHLKSFNVNIRNTAFMPEGKDSEYEIK